MSPKGMTRPQYEDGNLQRALNHKVGDMNEKEIAYKRLFAIIPVLTCLSNPVF
jgi:hypothetical protein